MPYFKKRKGMRIGSGHSWRYKSEIWNERKISPRTWTFTYTQTKHRKGRSAPKGTGFPIGGKLHWKIRADQYAIKTGPNTYKLIMRGKKYRKGWKTSKDTKWR